jgi:threonine dehydrogenase-like Zn-dependent dehydrogenase
MRRPTGWSCIRRTRNTASVDNADEALIALTGGTGYDDVFVFAPVRPVVEQGDRILGKDGCLNFFAGPTDPSFAAEFNFYDVHYASHHVVGTSGATQTTCGSPWI